MYDDQFSRNKLTSSSDKPLKLTESVVVRSALNRPYHVSEMLWSLLSCLTYLFLWCLYIISVVDFSVALLKFVRCFLRLLLFEPASIFKSFDQRHCRFELPNPEWTLSSSEVSIFRTTCLGRAWIWTKQPRWWTSCPFRAAILRSYLRWGPVCSDTTQLANRLAVERIATRSSTELASEVAIKVTRLLSRWAIRPSRCCLSRTTQQLLVLHHKNPLRHRVPLPSNLIRPAQTPLTLA